MPILENLSNHTLKSKKSTVGNYGKSTLYIPRDTYKKATEGKTTRSVKTTIPVDKIEEFIADTLDEHDVSHNYYVSMLTPLGWRSSGKITRGTKPNFSSTVNGSSFELVEDETIQDVTVYAFQVVAY